MNFDDIDFSALSDEQRQEILQLWRDDRYGFYARWDNPAEVQEKMVQWQRETEPQYEETPVDKEFEIIGALKAAGAPQTVIDYYIGQFNDMSDKYANARPNEKHDKVVAVFDEIFDDLNWDEEGLPEYSDTGLDFPYHPKWVDIVDGTYFLMADGVKHRVSMKHYRKWRSNQEIIEMLPTENDLSFLCLDIFKTLPPDEVNVQCVDGKPVLKLIYWECYDR